MSTSRHGPSRYYASDKNVFDALNQHKVDASTISKLFLSRNILVSRRTPRTDLADYFSRLNHDYYDHKEIASRLGIAAKRERITSMIVGGSFSQDDLANSIQSLKHELEGLGNTVHVSKSADSYTLSIEYTTVDYKRSEFTQVQRRDGTIEIAPEGGSYVVRNTKNDYLDDARDNLLSKLSALSGSKIDRSEISLSDVPDNRLRSKFFYEVAFGLPGYSIRDVTAAYVYKSIPEKKIGDDLDDEGEIDTVVQRVHLGGQGITRSELLNELIDGDQYYVVKMTWRVRQQLSKGDEHEFQAVFTDPDDCTGFSFILSGVYPRDPETGRISAKRRGPTRPEAAAASRIIETRARLAQESIRKEFQEMST